MCPVTNKIEVVQYQLRLIYKYMYSKYYLSYMDLRQAWTGQTHGSKPEETRSAVNSFWLGEMSGLISPEYYTLSKFARI